MVYSFPFVKASGAGNDFVLLDGREGGLPPDLSRLARALCSRHFGIGGDGLLVLLPSAQADFRMEYFNADGSHGGMCGNGGRCIARYATLSGITGSLLRFEALDFVYEAAVEGDRVSLRMKDPSGYRPGVIPDLLEPGESAHFVDTGSPHVVLLAEDVERIRLEERGPAIRYHAEFSPTGTNVNFVQILSETSVRMRTYERGVEAETLACGTGAVASAVVAWKAGQARPPVTVHTSGGEDLVVDFQLQGERVSGTRLTGSAHMVFQGRVRYDDSTGRLSQSAARLPFHTG